MSNTIQSIPEARLLLASLRSVGYSEDTAIADIIDNCITAEASLIDIFFDWENKRILIVDNGRGMSSENLIKNMRIGSSDPSDYRDEGDLGRFGMGMKTAAFSLGKKLTVVTKTDEVVSNAVWDLDQIPNIGWNLIVQEPGEIADYAAMLGEQGTVVAIEELDRVIDLSNEGKAKKKFYAIAGKVEKHISLTFHRFIEEDNAFIQVAANHMTLFAPLIPALTQLLSQVR